MRIDVINKHLIFNENFKQLFNGGEIRYSLSGGNKNTRPGKVSDLQGTSERKRNQR